jgi:hypothetical protein
MMSRFPNISYEHNSNTGETNITGIEGFVEPPEPSFKKKDIKGCGCRYLDGKCEYLCAHHTQQFILELYNNEKQDST